MSAWAVQDDRGHYLTIDHHGLLLWTPDEADALRLATQADAEKVLGLAGGINALQTRNKQVTEV